MNDDDLRARRNGAKGVRDRILPPLAALDDNHIVQIRRWVPCKVGGERYDDLVERVACEKRIDRALEDRHAGEQLKLLRLRATEPGAAAGRSNDRGNVHVLGLYLVGSWWLVVSGWSRATNY